MTVQSRPQEQALLKNQDNIFPDILENYKEICYNIENAKAKYRKSDDIVRLMAVTKTVAPEKINYAASLGATLLGENRVQEFLSKKDSYTKDAHVLTIDGSAIACTYPRFRKIELYTAQTRVGSKHCSPIVIIYE